MSKALEREVARTTSLDGTARLLLVAIARCCKSSNGVEICRTTWNDLERGSWCSRSVLQRRLLQLIDAGLVERRNDARNRDHFMTLVLTPAARSNSSARRRPQPVVDVNQLAPQVARHRKTSQDIAGRTSKERVNHVPVTTDGYAHTGTRNSHREKALSVSFFEVWNEHCGQLPGVPKPPKPDDPLLTLAERVLDRVDDEAHLARAIERAAGDELYVRQRYGWETFCRHIDRWLADPQLEPKSQREVSAQRARDVRELVRTLLHSGDDVDLDRFAEAERPIAQAAIDEWIAKQREGGATQRSAP